MSTTSVEALRRPSGVLNKQLAGILGGAMCFYIAAGMTTPILASFVKHDLHDGAVVVGVVIGIVAVSAILIRPWLTPRVDHWGSQRVMATAVAIGALAFGAAGLVGSSVQLGGVRLVTGAAQAAMLVAAMTAVSSAAPAARGQAISYFTVAPYLGMAMGPVIGKAIADAGGNRAALLSSGGVCLLGIGPLSFVQNDAKPRLAARAREQARGPLLHGSALLPGAALALGLLGMVGMNAFLALYLEELGSANAGWYFLEFGAIVLGFRTLGARIPDRVGAARSGTAATVLLLFGLVVIASAPSPALVAVGLAPFAAGIALQYPGLMTFALGRASASEQTRAVSTFTMFLDLSTGLGGVAVGIIAAVAGYRAIFVCAAITACLSFLILVALVRDAKRAERD